MPSGWTALSERAGLTQWLRDHATPAEADAVLALGPDCVEAVMAGLTGPSTPVRRWSALAVLAPLLRADPGPVDPVPWGRLVRSVDAQLERGEAGWQLRRWVEDLCRRGLDAAACAEVLDALLRTGLSGGGGTEWRLLREGLEQLWPPRFSAWRAEESFGWLADALRYDLRAGGVVSLVQRAEAVQGSPELPSASIIFRRYGVHRGQELLRALEADLPASKRLFAGRAVGESAEAVWPLLEDLSGEPLLERIRSAAPAPAEAAANAALAALDAAVASRHRPAFIRFFSALGVPPPHSPARLAALVLAIPEAEHAALAQLVRDAPVDLLRFVLHESWVAGALARLPPEERLERVRAELAALDGADADPPALDWQQPATFLPEVPSFDAGQSLGEGGAYRVWREGAFVFKRSIAADRERDPAAAERVAAAHARALLAALEHLRAHPAFGPAYGALIPPLWLAAGGVLIQPVARGLMLHELAPELRERAEAGIGALTAAAAKALQDHVPVRAVVDANPWNFRFDATTGEVVSWFDPLSVTAGFVR